MTDAVNLAFERGKGPANDPDLEATADLAWLIGTIYCDGSCYHNSAGDYIASLYAVDKEFVDAFEQKMADIGLNCDRYFNQQQEYNDLYEARIYSKKFFEWWERLDQQRIEEIARKYPASFVGGVYDSDGCLDNQNRVRIRRNNEWLLELVRELVRTNTGVEFLEIYQRDNSMVINLVRKDEVKTFCEWVENTITRKRIDSAAEGDA